MIGLSSSTPAKLVPPGNQSVNRWSSWQILLRLIAILQLGDRARRCDQVAAAPGREHAVLHDLSLLGECCRCCGAADQILIGAKREEPALIRRRPKTTLSREVAVGSCVASAVHPLPGHPSYFRANQIYRSRCEGTTDGGDQLTRRAGGRGGVQRHPDRDRLSRGWEAQAPVAVWPPRDKQAAELAVLQAAISRQAAGDMAQADALYERAVRLNRRNEEALHRWALVKQAIGQHNAALDLLNRVIQLNSKGAIAYCHRGYVLQDMGRRREAAKSLERAVQLKPEYVDALIALGAVQGELGAFEAACATLDRALVLDPRAREAVLNKGALFESQGLLKEAIAAFDAGLQTLPADAEMLHRKINCLHRLGELEAALSVGHVQLAARPGEARALTSMANTLRALGRLAEALAYHGQAMASASVRPDDLMDAAMCHLAVGNCPPAFVFMSPAGRQIAALSSWTLIISHSGRVSEILLGAQSSFGQTRAWATRCNLCASCHSWRRAVRG